MLRLEIASLLNFPSACTRCQLTVLNNSVAILVTPPLDVLDSACDIGEQVFVLEKQAQLAVQVKVWRGDEVDSTSIATVGQSVLGCATGGAEVSRLVLLRPLPLQLRLQISYHACAVEQTVAAAAHDETPLSERLHTLAQALAPPNTPSGASGAASEGTNSSNSSSGVTSLQGSAGARKPELQKPRARTRTSTSAPRLSAIDSSVLVPWRWRAAPGPFRCFRWLVDVGATVTYGTPIAQVGLHLTTRTSPGPSGRDSGATSDLYGRPAAAFESSYSAIEQTLHTNARKSSSDVASFYYSAKDDDEDDGNGDGKPKRRAKVAGARISGQYAAYGAADGDSDNGSGNEEPINRYLAEGSDGDEEEMSQLLATAGTDDDPTKGDEVTVITWDDARPGIVKSLDCVLFKAWNPEDVLFTVDVSLKAQKQALLIAADRVAFKASEEATSVKHSETLNSRFQQLSNRFSSSVSSGSFSNTHAVLECAEELERVVRDFYETARTYGRVIISEMHLPVESKSVRPLKLGGVLGGHKYVIRGVLFKIPNGETFSMYPDPLHIANKVQGLELKGLRAYFNWFFNKGALDVVSFPLAAVIDYKGHRITAMTQLPIKGSATLIYGADDAGSECNVKNEDPAWSTFIREASVGLNLKPHYVINGRQKGGEIELASCVDLEGHRGTDGRMYLLDFSRTFPPAFKEKEARPKYDELWPFYHMMRSEFVARAGPLCADSYSNFMSRVTPSRTEEAKQLNQEVRKATEMLKTDTVMRVCTALLSAASTSWSAVSVTHVFHRYGLNMRYLGLVYSTLMSKNMYKRDQRNLYTLVQTEAMMRVIKNCWRRRLREIHMTSAKEHVESRLLSTSTDVLNKAFGHCADQSAWMMRNPEAWEALMTDFSFSKNDRDHIVRGFVKKTEVTEVSGTDRLGMKYATLVRLNVKCGLGLSPLLLQELNESKEMAGRSFSQEVVFDDFDFHFEDRVKNLDIVERATAVRLYLRAQEACDDFNLSAAKDLFFRAFAVLESAVEANPADASLCMLMGDICEGLRFSIGEDIKMRQNQLNGSMAALQLLDKTKTKEIEARKQANALIEREVEKQTTLLQRFQERARDYYVLAAQCDKHSQAAHSKAGRFLFELGLYEEAVPLLMRACELVNEQKMELDFEALIALASALDATNNSELGSALRVAFKRIPELHDEYLTHGLSQSQSLDLKKPVSRNGSLSSVNEDDGKPSGVEKRRFLFGRDSGNNNNNTGAKPGFFSMTRSSRNNSGSTAEGRAGNEALRRGSSSDVAVAPIAVVPVGTGQKSPRPSPRNSTDLTNVRAESPRGTAEQSPPPVPMRTTPRQNTRPLVETSPTEAAPKSPRAASGGAVEPMKSPRLIVRPESEQPKDAAATKKTFWDKIGVAKRDK